MHRGRPLEPQFNRVGDNADHHYAVRIPVEQARPCKQVGDTDLVRRKPLVHGRGHLFAFDADLRAWGKELAAGLGDGGGV